MKRKIAIALILVLLMSVVVGTLVGCDNIVTMNASRDANQIVATVNYAGQTAYVYKYELSSSFNSYAYIYVNYYGMTYQDAADYLLQSLAQRELLVLFAKDELVKVLNESDGGSRTASTMSVEDFLSTSEINRAIENTNADMLSAINSEMESFINTAHNSTSNPDTEDRVYEEYTGTDALLVRFDSQGGSDVTTQHIKRGTAAFEPVAPTREGYTFYGWYTDKACTDGNEYTFTEEETLNPAENRKSVTLYAKWAEYTEPRAELPEKVEDADADYDPDADIGEENITVRAFGTDGKLNAAFRENIVKGVMGTVDEDGTAYDEYALDALKNYSADKKQSYLDEYLDRAAANVVEDFGELFTSYDYYLQNEMKTLLVTRLERVIGSSESVTEAEVQARFDELVAQNREAFNEDTDYESALTSSLSSTYYHKYTAENERYGFVVNILLQLEDKQLAELTAMVESGNYNENKSVITERRNELLGEMTVYVSNPDYDPDYKCVSEDGSHTCGNGSTCDPMTCPAHAGNHGDDNPMVTVEGEGYNQLIDFVWNEEEGKFELVYNVKACPAMAYLPVRVPAFSSGDTVGVIDQMYAVFGAIADAVENEDGIDGHKLTHVEGVYWMREAATAWLYLVGDDAGGTTSSSNNGGLGYLITPEGKESSYIESFTEQARALIANGTASFERKRDGGATEGNFFVYGDNFIESGSTDGAYAGIFVIVASSVPYDTNGWGSYTVVDNGDDTYTERKLEASEFANGLLPLDYVVKFAESLEDCETIGMQIENSLLTNKQAAAYETKANAFGVANYRNISYNRGAYESLWKNLG